MAANASKAELAAYCRDLPLSHHTEWDLVVNCPGCEKWVCQRIGAIGRKVSDGPLDPVLRRLRCSGCGKAYPNAWIKRSERWIAVEERASW